MKFYIIDRDVLEPKEHHIIFPFDFINEIDYCSWLINLTENELNEIRKSKKEILHFLQWNCINSFEVPLWNFLKTKFSFIKTKEYSNGAIIGINSFDLSEYDLMYIRLLK